MVDNFYGPEDLNEYYSFGDDKKKGWKSKYNIGFDWPEKDLMRIYHKFAIEFDNKVMHEICSHYDCDLSEFKEWVEIKRKETKC